MTESCDLQEVVDEEANETLSIVQLAAYETREQSTTADVSLLDLSDERRLKASGNLLHSSLSRFNVLPISGEYLALIGGLPASVLPFTSLKEVSLLLSLLPESLRSHPK